DLGQQHLHHLFQQTRVAPIDVEGLVEDLSLIAPIHKNRMQRPVEVVALLEPRRLDRLDGTQHLAWPDTQAGGAQGSREVGDVGRERVAARLRRRLGNRQRVHQPSGWAAMSDFTLRRISAASEPCSRWMSSWYFNNTPSVSLMVLGSRSRAFSSDSAV